VVTGATSGIGKAIACALAAQGLTVVLVGRSDDRLHAAEARIRSAMPDADLRLERADLSLLGDVRALAGRLSGEPLPDVVVSNAAVVADPRDRTSEGLPRTLVTNHLAPYLLLRSLIRPLAGRGARFVVVGASPTALKRVPVDLDDLTFESQRALGLLRQRPTNASASTPTGHSLHERASSNNYARRRKQRADRLGPDIRRTFRALLPARPSYPSSGRTSRPWHVGNGRAGSTRRRTPRHAGDASKWASRNSDPANEDPAASILRHGPIQTSRRTANS
jgi:NAD(P)-dependent dehydrogenase (short-subunit alcohol dehydrogenase family)